MKRSAGQAVIFALLLTAVVITVGLAVVSQSVIDVKTSTQSQETVKAFTAAEAGIEQALGQALVAPSNTTITLPPTQVGNATFNASVNQLGLAQPQYVFPRPMVSGDAQTLWLVSHKADGNLGCDGGLSCATFPGASTFDVYFGTAGASGPPPALVLDVYYKNPARGADYRNVKISRVAIDPVPTDASRGSTSNNFNGSSTTGLFSLLGNSLTYKATINLGTASPNNLNIPPAVYQTVDGLQIIRARIYYSTSAHVVGFDFGSNLTGGLPSQGFQPQSVGSVPGSSSIKLTSVYPWPDTFAMFDHAIFAGSGDLCKGGC